MSSWEDCLEEMDVKQNKSKCETVLYVDKDSMEEDASYCIQ